MKEKNIQKEKRKEKIAYRNVLVSDFFSYRKEVRNGYSRNLIRNLEGVSSIHRFLYNYAVIRLVVERGSERKEIEEKREDEMKKITLIELKRDGWKGADKLIQRCAANERFFNYTRTPGQPQFFSAKNPEPKERIKIDKKYTVTDGFMYFIDLQHYLDVARICKENILRNKRK